MTATTPRDEIIAALGVRPDMISGNEIVGRVQFLKDYLLQTGARGYVLGISGGQDSTLAGRLAQLAVAELRHEQGDAAATFTAMRLPYGEQADEADARLALGFIQPDETVVFNIKPAVDAVKATYDALGTPLSDYTKGNVKARMRMVAQYAHAGEHKLLVIGTDHAAEAVTGFFTKFGDGAADILPLSGLSKRQGKELLQVLGAPARLYEKAPTADLLDLVVGQADETELGITYDQLDDYLEGKPVAPDVATMIEARYATTMHKRLPPVVPTMTY